MRTKRKAEESGESDKTQKKASSPFLPPVASPGMFDSVVLKDEEVSAAVESLNNGIDYILHLSVSPVASGCDDKEDNNHLEAGCSRVCLR